MLCPAPEVMRDAKANHDGDHRNAVERILVKWILMDVSINLLYIYICMNIYDAILQCFLSYLMQN